MKLPLRSASLFLASVGFAIFAGEPHAHGQAGPPTPPPVVKPAISSPTTLGTIRDQQDELKARFEQGEQQIQAILGRQEKAIERLIEQVAKLEAELKAARDPRRAKVVPLDFVPQTPTRPIAPSPSSAGQP